MDDFLQILISGLSQGAIYGLMALGMTVVFRSTTVLNFGHGEAFMLGAFVSLAFIDAGIPYLLSIILGVLSVLVLGMIINKVAFEPLLEGEHTTQVFATIAVAFIIKGVARYFSIDHRGMPPLLSTGHIPIGGALINPQHLMSFLALVIVSIIFGFVFLRTRAGRILRACTQSVRGSSLVGINVKQVFTVMWGVGPALGAIAGVLAAPTLLVSPDIGGRPLLLGFAAMALGGFGNFVGAVAGGLLLGLIEVFAAFYVSTTLGSVAGFAVILVILLVRPQGIFGSSEVA